MLKWMKKKLQSKTKLEIEQEERSDIDYFHNMDETLESRDGHYAKLTKLALGPASSALEKYILYYFEDGVAVNIRSVDRLIPNVLKLSGTATLQNGEVNTFTFVLPIHLISSSVDTQDISLLLKFTEDYQKLLSVDSVTEEELIKITTLFTRDRADRLSDISEYNKMFVDLGQDDIMGFDRDILTENQMKSFIKMESGILN